jgi:GNAT superfamily N-acetyltransferase
MVGGACGELWGQSLHVSALWVADELRGHGYGAALLRTLESHAVQVGQVLAYVETLSYQARPFYEKQGYRLFGELDGIAEGCALYFLRKDLKQVTSSPAHQLLSEAAQAIHPTQAGP